MGKEPSDADKKEDVLKQVSDELASAGLNVTRSGDDITVYEDKAEGGHAADDGGKPQGAKGASTGKNIGNVLIAALAVPFGLYVVAAIYFGVAFALIDYLTDPPIDGVVIGIRAGMVAMLIATAVGSAGSFVTGLSAKTLAGKHDIAAAILGLVLGVALALAAIRVLDLGLRLLFVPNKLGGFIAAGLFIFLVTGIGDRLFRER